MRVALVYDRLNKLGGAEQVLIAFAKLYPGADWYTSFWDPIGAPFSRNWKVFSFPYLRHHHEWFPWAMPFIFESFDLSGYDLVISIGSAESKGVITKPETLHLNYCLTPTRYLYSHRDHYLTNPLYRRVAQVLRKWDLVAATRPDEMIAISTQVKKRIKDVYNRTSAIIFPPVDTAKFAKPSSFEPAFKNYYLTVARLVSYKRLEVLVQAFNENKRTLVIIGEGSERKRLKRMASHNVHFLGSVSDQELIGYYQHAKAFLHAGEEDFGIAMCEAQAAGIPVIAYKRGGASDIVQPGVTGLLVEESSATSFNHALLEFDTIAFESAVCQQNVRRFDQTNWIKQISERIDSLCQTHA